VISVATSRLSAADRIGEITAEDSAVVGLTR
jgi:hypothetical protein